MAHCVLPSHISKAFPGDGRSVKSAAFGSAGIALPFPETNFFDVLHPGLLIGLGSVRHSGYDDSCGIAARFFFIFSYNPALFHLGIQFALSDLSDGGIHSPGVRKPPNQEYLERLSAEEVFYRRTNVSRRERS